MFYIPANIVEGYLEQVGENDISREEDGSIKLPSTIIVCPRCGGKGSHDHPAFSNGFTREDEFVDEDFIEEYEAGTYDVSCEVCHGRNVVDEPDETKFNNLQKKIFAYYCEYQNEVAESRAEERAERRMGA